MLCRFFANFCHEIGWENDQTYIFRFVRDLSTFFHTGTYLPINIPFQLIIITNVSFATNPAYFVGHLASPIISFWRSRDLPKITLTSKYTCLVCLHFTVSHPQKKKLTKKHLFIQIIYWKIYVKKIHTLISF